MATSNGKIILMKRLYLTIEHIVSCRMKRYTHDAWRVAPKENPEHVPCVNFPSAVLEPIRY